MGGACEASSRIWPAGSSPAHPVDWPGGETAASVADRAARVATTVRGLGGPVVVVSHGRFLAALHAELVAGTGDATEPIPFAPGSVIRVRFAGREGNG